MNITKVYEKFSANKPDTLAAIEKLDNYEKEQIADAILSINDKGLVAPNIILIMELIQFTSNLCREKYPELDHSKNTFAISLAVELIMHILKNDGDEDS